MLESTLAIHTYIHKYIHTYLHTHTHTHTYIYRHRHLHAYRHRNISANITKHMPCAFLNIHIYACECAWHISSRKLRWINYSHENHKKEAQIQRQVKQVSYKFQVKGVDSLFLPLSFHKHVTDIENIFYECWHSCCCEYHVPEIQNCKNYCKMKHPAWLEKLHQAIPLV